MPDEATKIVHSSQPTIHRGDDPSVVHNPSGETGQQPMPGRQNPTGDTADGYAGMPRRSNPLGDGGGGSLGADEAGNPLGGTSSSAGNMPARKNPS
jgi:hypothetical protein